MPETSKIIIGIDPGTVIMGIGIIEVSRSKAVMVMMDILKLSSRYDNHKRLQLIHEKVSEVIRTYKPQELAIEAPFFGKNVQSMLKLGRAQGVAIAAAMQSGISVVEYSPRKIKQSITGNGNADKLQVLKMLQRILNFVEQPKYLDAADALAVAVCHHFQQSGILPQTGKLKGWDDFLKQNPARISPK